MANTLQDVADEAGVAINTVRKALRDDPTLRPYLKERVAEAVSKLNYRPNLVAKALSQQASNVIPLSIIELQNPYFGQMAQAMSQALSANGYEPVLCVRADRLLDLNHSLSTRASVVCYSIDQAQLRELVADHAVVTIHSLLAPLPGTANVAIDFAPAYRALTQRLLAEGRRRMAICSWLLAGDGVYREQTVKFDGIGETLATQGLALQRPADAPVFRDAAAVAAHLAANPEALDAVFCENDQVAADLLVELLMIDRTLAERVRIIGCDGIHPAPSTWTVRIDLQEMARAAVALLQGLLDDPGSQASATITPHAIDAQGTTF